MMAAPLMAGNDLRAMDRATVDILCNLEAIGINQDPLGAQGRIVWDNGNLSLWAGKPLFDGSAAVLVLHLGSSRARRRISWKEVGFAAEDEFYVRNIWTHETSGPHSGGIEITVGPDEVAFLRISKTNEFPVPPVLVADRTRVMLRSNGSGPEELKGTLTIANRGSSDLPLWRVDPETVPPWLSVEVTGKGRNQTFINTASTAGLRKDSYHAVVRADNVEPISGKPMSSFYYDVDLEVRRGIGK
jgi:hypothetical protein